MWLIKLTIITNDIELWQVKIYNMHMMIQKKEMI